MLFFTSTTLPFLMPEVRADGCAPVPYDLTAVNITTAKAPNAPVPLVIPEPSGQNEALHPSVVYVPNGWNGYRYWMLYTPYDFTAASNENPHVDVSNDGQTWIEAPGVANPIEPWPGPAYLNSDTDLLLGPDNTMYAFWRQLFISTESIYYRTSTDGTNWINKTLALRRDSAERRLLSPTVIWDGTNWWMWTVNSQTTPYALEMWTAASPSGPWTGPMATDLTAPPGRDLWHTEIRRVGDKLIQLVQITFSGSNSNGVLYLAQSTNGANWVRGASPVLTGTRSAANVHPVTFDDTLYRSAFVPFLCNGSLKLAIWYSGRSFWFPQQLGYTEATITGIIVPDIQLSITNNNDVLLTFQSLTGNAYQLQANISLALDNWVNIGTPSPGTGGILTLTDPGTVSSLNRWYRLKISY